MLELDLATVMPSVAGPRRPQDRVELRGVKQSFRSAMVGCVQEGGGRKRHAPAGPVVGGGAGVAAGENRRRKWGRGGGGHLTKHLHDDMADDAAVICSLDDQWVKLTHGDVTIAAITSCTNTSNPSVMVAAGLLAKEGGREAGCGAAVCENVAGAG